jgi:hypothetical protein
MGNYSATIKDGQRFSTAGSAAKMDGEVAAWICCGRESRITDAPKDTALKRSSVEFSAVPFPHSLGLFFGLTPYILLAINFFI